MGNFPVCHYFLYRKNWNQLTFYKNLQKVLYIRVFWQLQHYVLAEFQSVIYNIRKLRVHYLIQIPVTVLRKIYSAPRRTDNKSISFKWLNFKKICAKIVKTSWAFFVHFKIMFKHFKFALVNIVYYVLFKQVCNLNGYTSHSGKRFKYFLYFGLCESFSKMYWNWLRNDWVPTFFIKLYSFLKPREKKVSSCKVFIYLFGYFVLQF